jgi:hypothetical protein
VWITVPLVCPGCPLPFPPPPPIFSIDKVSINFKKNSCVPMIKIYKLMWRIFLKELTLMNFLKMEEESQL